MGPHLPVTPPTTLRHRPLVRGVWSIKSVLPRYQSLNNVWSYSISVDPTGVPGGTVASTVEVDLLPVNKTKHREDQSKVRSRLPSLTIPGPGGLSGPCCFRR